MNFGKEEKDEIEKLELKAKDKPLTFEEECLLSMAKSLAILARKVGRKLL